MTNEEAGTKAINIITRLYFDGPVLTYNSVIEALKDGFDLLISVETIRCRHFIVRIERSKIGYNAIVDFHSTRCMHGDRPVQPPIIVVSRCATKVRLGVKVKIMYHIYESLDSNGWLFGEMLLDVENIKI